MPAQSEPVTLPDEDRSDDAGRDELTDRFRRIRNFTLKLCEPLETEDFVVQSMPDVSPTKWHLAHTSWFFEEFMLKNVVPGYASPHPQYSFLFNSYYVKAGPRHFRPRRGLITRPTVQEVLDYRRHVDRALVEWLGSASDDERNQWRKTLEIGLHHEQQHQELILTDIKHVLWNNPLRPAYRRIYDLVSEEVEPLEWIEYQEGIRHVGHEGDGFAFDNEGPRHRVFLEPFAVADRLITNGEYLDFMADDGYTRPELWLSAGWDTVQQEDWRAPLYWEPEGDQWRPFTLSGMQELHPDEPVCHLSYFEADAYARWAGARLLTEFEWEAVSHQASVEGNFADAGFFHPIPMDEDAREHRLKQMFGDCWEWTASHYSPYPGYRPAEGALGEYNGKWMCNQFVLRGGSCATSLSHIRRTYRNFFPSNARWQFSGLRLARTL